MYIKRVVKNILGHPPIYSNIEKEEIALQQLEEFTDLNDNRFKLKKEDLFLCANDDTPNTTFNYQYIYHHAWAARIIRAIDPR